MNKIYFSTVWEDYKSLKNALQPSKKDTILTISSSGDNVFNFLSDKVKKVIAVDFNPAQLALARLKLEIINKYDLNKVIELLEGLGSKKENIKLTQSIISSFNDIKRWLHGYNFSNGINNIGQFDTKVIPIFRFFIRRFFKPAAFHGSATQEPGFGVWLKILLFIFSRKSTYKFLMPDFPYQYINIDIRNSLENSLNNFLKFNDFSQNWYLQKVYNGKYQLMPPFLRKNNFDFIKKNAGKIEFVQGDILDYLKKSQNKSVDKINYSDIFDWCSIEQLGNILKESHRILSDQGIICYRELFVSREIPDNLLDKFENLTEIGNKLHKRDNTPFYYKIVILKKRRKYIK